MDNLKFEKALYLKQYQCIAGVDEVGRGCIAGPVCACAIIMSKDDIVEGVKDSKKLTDKKRRFLYNQIIEKSLAYFVTFIDNQQIDKLNILEASKQAMTDAVLRLSQKPDHVLVDALSLSLDVPQTSIIHGDDLSYTIGCASIVAKVTRDDYMIKMNEQYPGYDLQKNKGYPTKKHVEALMAKGVTPIHRCSFKPVYFYIKKEA